jgi:hypothetical protein
MQYCTVHMYHLKTNTCLHGNFSVLIEPRNYAESLIILDLSGRGKNQHNLSLQLCGLIFLSTVTDIQILRINIVADPDPGSGNIQIRDLIFENLVSVFCGKNIKLFDADPDPGSRHPGSRIRNGKRRIRDKHPGSATLRINNVIQQCAKARCLPEVAEKTRG